MSLEGLDEGRLRALEIEVFVTLIDKTVAPVWVHDTDEAIRWIDEVARRVFSRTLDAVVQQLRRPQPDPTFFRHQLEVFAVPSERHKDIVRHHRPTLQSMLENDLSIKFGAASVHLSVRIVEDRNFLESTPGSVRASTTGQPQNLPPQQAQPVSVGSLTVIPAQGMQNNQGGGGGGVQSPPIIVIQQPAPTATNEEKKEDKKKPQEPPPPPPGATMVLFAVLIGGLVFALVSMMNTMSDLRGQLEKAQTEVRSVTKEYQSRLSSCEWTRNDQLREIDRLKDDVEDLAKRCPRPAGGGGTTPRRTEVRPPAFPG